MYAPLTAINKLDLSYDIDRDISMSSGAALNANVHSLLLCRQLLDIDRKQLALIPNYCHRNRIPKFLDKLEHASSSYFRHSYERSSFVNNFTVRNVS